MEGEAVLTSDRKYTSFIYGDKKIRFMTSPYLERYLSVKQWDDGYMVVMAKYDGAEAEEEYIDLVPILKNLYIDPKDFLKDIKKVRISYE